MYIASYRAPLILFTTILHHISRKTAEFKANCALISPYNHQQEQSCSDQKKSQYRNMYEYLMPVHEYIFWIVYDLNIYKNQLYYYLC